LVNTAPYGDGWIFKIKISKPDQVAGLLSPSAYGVLIS
jgi:glycine cleavage system H protein